MVDSIELGFMVIGREWNVEHSSGFFHTIELHFIVCLSDSYVSKSRRTSLIYSYLFY